MAENVDSHERTRCALFVRQSRLRTTKVVSLFSLFLPLHHLQEPKKCLTPDDKRIQKKRVEANSVLHTPQICFDVLLTLTNSTSSSSCFEHRDWKNSFVTKQKKSNFLFAEIVKLQKTGKTFEKKRVFNVVQTVLTQKSENAKIPSKVISHPV